MTFICCLWVLILFECEFVFLRVQQPSRNLMGNFTLWHCKKAYKKNKSTTVQSCNFHNVPYNKDFELLFAKQLQCLIFMWKFRWEMSVKLSLWVHGLKLLKESIKF